MTLPMHDQSDILKFHHIGLVVPKIIAGRTHLDSLVGPLIWGDSFEDDIQDVNVCFGRDLKSELVYELIEPSVKGSPIDTALKENKNILNHIAYKSNDFKGSCHSLRDNGCIPVSRSQPAVAFDGAKIIFFLTPLKFIIEIIEG